MTLTEVIKGDFMSQHRADRIRVETVEELAQRGGLTPPQSAINVDSEQQRNTIRSLWGANAFVAYATCLSPSERREQIATSFSDFLGDLMHTADALGIDFEEAADDARGNYQEEIDGF
ncbi:hypothetical protein [Mycobacteroides abscessus]|uniref:hypothetical protein n=1 Tax=Mycobacteroides abscessus TaxID=36809 RepID=UPI000941DBD8|nr:hypothetical protein [Mycobacteroides abscessus]